MILVSPVSINSGISLFNWIIVDASVAQRPWRNARGATPASCVGRALDLTPWMAL
jgi:hypothetical protein